MLSGKNHGEFSCPREQLLSEAVQVSYVMRHHSDRGLTQFVLFRNNDINEEDILNITFSTNIHMQESQGSHLNNRRVQSLDLNLFLLPTVRHISSDVTVKNFKEERQTSLLDLPNFRPKII